VPQDWEMRWFWIARGMPNEGPHEGVNLP
jgi:hypothetical protein